MSALSPGSRAPIERDALTATSLDKRLGGLAALDGVSLAVPSGKITGLIGPNGAGKTTLFNALSGVLPADTGKVHLFGNEITHLPPHRIAQAGLIRTFQLSREFGSLTVLENLLLAPQGQLGETLRGVFFSPGKVWAEELAHYHGALEILETVLLADHKDTPASQLSGGQKKLLELGRALMANPRIILLDEPGAGVNPALMEQLCSTIRTINRDRDMTFLIVEHDMNLIAQLCDKVVVMAQGRNLVEGTFDEVIADERVIVAYLGKVSE